ncbi:UNVERIFIED_CONTAM: hypothetical protein FKN15_040358 [Acipenser sinensis]
MLAVPPTVQGQGSLSLGQPRRPPPSPPPERQSHGEGLSQAVCQSGDPNLIARFHHFTAQQQLEFLEGRRKKYMKAAIQAKQKNDLEQAKSFLRTAKGFEPMIEAAKNGKAVDISKVPSPPGDEEDDFILVHHSDVQISQKAEDVYMQLAKILKEQCEKCVSYTKQFTQLGNIAETTKFEKMSEDCKKNLEILKLAQAQGLDPPKHHFEKRTYSIVRGFLRSDKPVGTVHLKLEKLETECEVREIVELFDGRKPTGGRLEVRAQLKEPLSGQDVQQVTERWLVLEQPKVERY